MLQFAEVIWSVLWAREAKNVPYSCEKALKPIAVDHFKGSMVFSSCSFPGNADNCLSFVARQVSMWQWLVNADRRLLRQLLLVQWLTVRSAIYTVVYETAIISAVGYFQVFKSLQPYQSLIIVQQSHMYAFNLWPWSGLCVTIQTITLIGQGLPNVHHWQF